MRYRDDNELDDPTIMQGDNKFIRLNTRVHPTELQPGEVQQSQNMRLEDFTPQPRKGLTKVNADISLDDTPLVLPFTLPATVKTTYTDGVYGSGMFSDPLNSNMEWVVLATGNEAYLWRDGETPVSIGYPSGQSCDDTDTVHIEQVNEDIYLFRGYDDSNHTDGTVVWEAITADAWSASTTYYANEIVRSSSNGYILICTTGGTSAATEPSWSAGTGNSDNTAAWTAYPLAAWAATTAYSSTYNAAQPTFRTIDSAATVIRVTTSGTSGSTEPDMKDRPVLKWDGNQSNDFTVVAQKRPTSATHRSLTAAPYSLYYRSRLTKPVSRTEFNVSGILTPEDFDQVQNQFKINYGSKDYLVGFSPFQEDKLLILYRDSVHLALNFSGSLSNIAVQEVIRGVGCAARRTIISAGEHIYWLGDGGIYSLNIVDQLNLKGVDVPLTRDIQDVFATINMEAVDKAHGIYHNNRLYFAVPTGTETRPDKVLVYNLLNQGWESIDTYAPYVDGFQIADYGKTKRLIIITKEAAIYVAEDNEDGDETGIVGEETAQTSTIAGIFRTRAYRMDGAGLARYRRMSASVYTPGAGGISIEANLQDPDAVVDLGSITNTASEDKFFRRNISKRAFACDLTFTTTSGRPAIRAVSLEATQQYRTGDTQ